MPDRMSKQMLKRMPEGMSILPEVCQIECQNKDAICTSKWGVRNSVRIVFQGGGSIELKKLPREFACQLLHSKFGQAPRHNGMFFWLPQGRRTGAANKLIGHALGVLRICCGLSCWFEFVFAAWVFQHLAATQRTRAHAFFRTGLQPEQHWTPQCSLIVWTANRALTMVSCAFLRPHLPQVFERVDSFELQI